VDLERRRSAWTVLADGLGIWARHLGTFTLIAAAMAIPIEILVGGVIGGRLLAPYDPNAPVSAGAAGPSNTAFGLVVTPIVWAASAFVLLDLAQGQAPNVRRALAAGSETFRRVLGAVALGGLGTVFGLILLIVPGVYLYVRWYFTVQAAAIDRASGLDPLRRSAELVKGNWWWAFGSVLLVTAVPLLGLGVLATLGQLAAYASGREAVSLLFDIVGDLIFFPLSGVVVALLYVELRARHGDAAALAAQTDNGSGP
jgi:hypothetical protein